MSVLTLLFGGDQSPANAREQLAKKLGFGFYASHIGPGGSYMRRFIFRHPFGTIRLHHILRSDDDRHLHDHPFDFTSFLLSGGYTETVPCDLCGGDGWLPAHHWTHHGQRQTCGDCDLVGKRAVFHPRFSIIRKKAQELHCLALDRPVWTLVFAGPKRREWGFQTEEGWVHNEEYAGRWPERVTRA